MYSSACGSGDAPQLAGRSPGSSSSDTSQRDASTGGTACMFRIGSFNAGLEQNMLASKRSLKTLRTADHIMNFCEFGGHPRGPHAAGINVKDMKIFDHPPSPSVSVHSNYLTCWGFDADTTQFSVKAAGDSKAYRLSSEKIEPELVVHKFENGAGV